jgi:hypothetical protein
MTIRKVCVFCASSRQAEPIYREAAGELGLLLAKHSMTTVYGGGAVGSMGALADGALAAGGQVIGVIPQFMVDLEWGHPGLTELIVVENMRERKRQMLESSDAVIALPGGSGTFEELFEAITMKRLGLFLGPIVIINTQGFYKHFSELMQHAVNEKFMDPRHLSMWIIINEASEVLHAFQNAVKWSQSARKFAAI